ncbi:IPT/TIG domain-containing protein [Pontibacter sp. FD36]|uniref:DUF7619 domain-containing protein n=1 Tax=Pontibacter sp. FD36 TaxID=2789860 RepID=UPI0018A8C795|nr:IPT/TIG domain-containing protein [Pontibacter sp. FD36]MBF8964997.1 IPT/TIG domain-containing protein [Pontibacter sp. FD36]
MSRVVKVKDGKILLDFKVNAADYNLGYDNEEGVVLQVAVDQNQNIYILNQKRMRIEKHDPQGKLVKIFPTVPVPDSNRVYNLSLHIDHLDRLHIFDSFDRKLYVYHTNGTLIETITLADPDPIWRSDHTFFTFDNQNNIYIADIKKSSWSPTAHITHIDREGKIIKRFSEAVMKESGFNKSYALALAVDKNGDVYAYNNGSVYINTIDWPIQVFSAEGTYKKSLSVNAFRGSLVLFDNQNNMYVRRINTSGDHILKYDQEQQLLERIGNLRRPYEVGFDLLDNLYILDHIKFQLIRYNAAGEEDKKFALADSRLINPLTFAIDDNGFIYILEYSGPSNTPQSRIKKFDSDGNYITMFSPSLPGYYNAYQGFISAGLAVDHTGAIYVTNFNNNDPHALTKLNPEGAIIAKYGPRGKEPGQLSGPLDVTVDAAGNVYVLDMNGKRVQKFSSNGKFIQEYGTYDKNEASFSIRASIASDAFGNVLVSTQTGTHSGDNSPDVKYYDVTGNLVYSAPTNFPSVAMNRRGSLATMADRNYDIVTVYEATTDREYNRIEGNIYHDVNANCELDETETSLADILVKAEPGPYYGATDAAGNYSLLVGKGTYTLAPLTENIGGKVLTPTCVSDEDAPVITFNNYGNYSANNNMGVQVTLSPYLTVSVSSTRRRRCFESTTTVRYANSGFATAADAKVYLQLPQEVGLLSADKSYTLLPDGTYEFSVGDLSAGQSGTITVADIVTCGDESVRGLTVCTRAWITPSNNQPTEPTPTVAITGRCSAETGMIRFVVRNTGTADMADPGLFRKYADGQLASVEQFRLAAGDSLVLWVPAMGYTWRIEADQPTGNGDNTSVSVTVEGCSGGEVSSVSTGKVNLLPTDDEEAEQSAECMPITDSYDPNDKLVTPAGRTAEFYTPTNTALKYKIRFQNTGTDVAYRVVVVDTLSEHLDLSTLQLGATSHPARVEVSGKGRAVLTWTFDNILLPDSTADEPGSHGYIQFSIKPKGDLPEKTLVENLADIFFDFNSPIRTNITQNRIFDMPPVINESVRVRLEDVLATPGIEGFEPAAGKLGSEVTITGQRFAMKPGDNKVYLNGRAATVVSATATELKVVVPTGATTGALKVITPDGGVTSTAKFQVYQPPVLASFSPAEGMVGQRVTLSGEHLQEALIESITLGELRCEIIEQAGNAVTVRVPENAATGAFTISTKGGEAVSGAAYTVWYAPGITALSKEAGIVGASITITGENFAADKTRNIVRFGQVQAQVLEASPRQLTVRVPEQAESGFVTLETPGGRATAGTAFEVIPGPRFRAMQPSSGAVGAVVEITGAHFGIMGQQDVITFNGQEALVLEALGDSYRVRVPRGATTGRVQITGYGGQAQSSADFVVVELTPAEAIQVYPNPNSGQFTVSLRHADFDVQLIELHDALGKRLHQTRITGPRPEAVEISLPTAKAGLYFLQIQTERGLIIRKLTIL